MLARMFNGDVDLRRLEWVQNKAGSARVYTDTRASEKEYAATCEELVAVVRRLAAGHSHVSVSSDWDPLPPLDLSGTRARPASQSAGTAAQA